MSKDGVGLVVTLSAASMGTLSFDVGNPPFQVEVFGSDAENPPADFAGWGSVLQAKTFSQVARRMDVPLPVPARHLLIVLREVGPRQGVLGRQPVPRIDRRDQLRVRPADARH